MKPLTIKVSTTLKASPNDIFDAVTNASQMLKWSGQKGVVQQKVGGKFEMFDGWVKGSVLGFERGKLLIVTWKPAEWSKDDSPSIVTYTFNESKAGTKVSVTQTGFPNPKEAQSHKDGWSKFVFEPLNKYLLQQNS